MDNAERCCQRIEVVDPNIPTEDLGVLGVQGENFVGDVVGVGGTVQEPVFGDALGDVARRSLRWHRRMTIKLVYVSHVLRTGETCLRHCEIGGAFGSVAEEELVEEEGSSVE
jgi:hypothetical protein